MPEIGRPQRPNQFKNIQMAEKSASKKKVNVGEELNEIVGKGGANNLKFVDRTVHNKMGKNEFLKLLTHQLTNQDPMNPVDQNKFAADLAQFSSLEQLSNMNTKLDNINPNARSENKFFGASFLGKKVMAKGSTVETKIVGEKKQIPVFLNKNAALLKVRLVDRSNQKVQEFIQPNVSAGQHYISWDGKGIDGHDSNPGLFRIEVHAFDKNHNKVAASALTEGKVTDVYFRQGQTVLKLEDSREIFLRDVESFSMSDNNGTKSHIGQMAKLQNNAAKAYNKVNEVGDGRQ